MMIRLITIRPILNHCLNTHTGAATSQSRAIPAHAEFAGSSSEVIKSSGLGVEWNAAVPITRELNESAAPAYNLTVDVDECYFVRGSDGRAYLVSNSSHGSDAFGLMCCDYEEPRAAIKPVQRVHRQGGWMR
jgi:hypothetical protein